MIIKEKCCKLRIEYENITLRNWYQSQFFVPMPGDKTVTRRPCAAPSEAASAETASAAPSAAGPGAYPGSRRHTFGPFLVSRSMPGSLCSSLSLCPSPWTTGHDHVPRTKSSSEIGYETVPRDPSRVLDHLMPRKTSRSNQATTEGTVFLVREGEAPGIELTGWANHRTQTGSVRE